MANLTAIFERQGDWLPADRLVSIAGTLLVLEACRRVIGLIMTGICLTAILYAFFGPYMPELIIHKGYSIERIATTLWLTTEGVFGLPIGVAATFVYVFVLFGAFLETTGGGNFFIELAHALTGRFLVLGMGLPVTASYIVLASLASFAGAGIAGANPMQTAFTSWKLAKGLYIIPLVMAYRPLLGVGENYSLMDWQVLITMMTTLLGLVAFAAAIERYLLRPATIWETALFALAATGLLWPETWMDAAGFAVLAVAVVLQKTYKGAATPGAQGHPT
jgi:TRAP-type uncharacterized transport system fused permease subunit